MKYYVLNILLSSLSGTVFKYNVVLLDEVWETVPSGEDNNANYWPHQNVITVYYLVFRSEVNYVNHQLQMTSPNKKTAFMLFFI